MLHAVLDGGITNGTVDYVQACLAAAEAEHAQAVVFELDTPGGLLDATRQIVRSVLAAKVPVLVYVAPAGARAGSAGLFLVLASHVAAMHPTSNIGAAHPVGAFGGEIEGTMADKVENDTAAWARSLAQAHARNSEWAQRAVTASAAITAREAEHMHVVDLLAASTSELLERADGRIVRVGEQPWRVSTARAKLVPFEPDLRQRAYAMLADPVLIYLLLLLGILGLYVEFQHPGLLLPGILGATCLLLVFGLQALPLNSLGVLLIALAALLFVAEVYVTSFGLLSVTALVCLIWGSSMLFSVEGSSFRLSRWVIWTTAGTFAAIAVLIGQKLLAIRRQGPTSGTEAAVGKPAEVCQTIAAGGTGKVLFDGTYWEATSEVTIPAHARCRVDAIEGLLLRVSPLPSTTPEEPT